MNINTAIRNRKLGLVTSLEIDFAISKIKLKDTIKLDPELAEDDETRSQRSGPLACARVGNDRLAVANEDGHVNIIQTQKLKNLDHWLAHENAIFDMKSFPDNKTVMTAAGDGSIRRWDVSTKQEILGLTPHYSSVKSISIYDANTVASGSRDGSIQIHDLRSKKPTMLLIRDAHKNTKIGKARKSISKTDPTSCVTNVAFDQNFPRIYSTGANDATIKLWDLRRISQTNKPRRNAEGQFLINQPTVEVHHPIKGMHCGYSHLVISSNKIYAACSDNKIYCYDNFGVSAEPIRYTGYRYDTYLKLAVLDDRFLVSGAKGGGAIMWSLGHKRSSIYMPETTKQPIGQLKPDNNDQNDTNVIEPDWDSLSLFTFRDDRLVCKWSLQEGGSNQNQNDEDVAIQMSDIIDVNVLRTNHRVSNLPLSL